MSLNKPKWAQVLIKVLPGKWYVTSSNAALQMRKIMPKMSFCSSVL